MLKKAQELTWKILFEPRKAAQLARRPDSLAPSLIIVVAMSVAFALFETWKPFDFPDRTAAFPREVKDLAYWIKAMLWMVPVDAISIVMVLGMLNMFKKGSFPIRFVGGLAWTALPGILFLAYKLNPIPKPIFAIGVFICYAGFIPLVAKSSREDWRGVAVFSFAINAVSIPMLSISVISVLVKYPPLYMAGAVIGAVWSFIVGILFLREFFTLRMPRACMALIYAELMFFLLVFCLHMLGWLPKEALAAMMPYS